MRKLVLLTLSIWLIGHSLSAQGTVEDYNRAFSLQDKLKDKVFYSNVTPQWIGNTNSFWYVRNTTDGKIYMLTDAKKKSRTVLFDHLKLTESLSKATKKKIEIEQLTLLSLKVSANLDTLRFVNNGIKWIYLQKKDSLINDRKQSFPKSEYWGKVDEEREGKPVVSADKKLLAFVKDNNIYIKDSLTGTVKALSTDGTKDDY
ncbi:MAG TPA: DPP IV N-terminal domain-containing protein, partial [Paludibacter sp.]